MPVGEFLHDVPVAGGIGARRAGHAAMTALLDAVDRRGAGDLVPADLLSLHAAALDEVLVGQELARLGDEWTVLHAVPVGPKRTVDHLVIGPGGVLVLTTARYLDRSVRVIDRAAEVRDLLRPVLRSNDVVQPLLVVVATRRLAGGAPAVRVGDLVDRLLALPPVLSPVAVRRVAARAALPVGRGRRSAAEEPDPTGRFLVLRTPAERPVTTLEAARPSALHLPARSCSAGGGSTEPGPWGAVGRALVTAGALVLTPPTLVLGLAWFLAALYPGTR